MRRSRFTAEQIIGILGEQEAGITTAEVCRKHGISQATFYAWTKKQRSTKHRKRSHDQSDGNSELYF